MTTLLDSALWQKCQCRRIGGSRGPHPLIFLYLLILRGFKSNEFVCADSAWVTDTFCVSAHSKELSRQACGICEVSAWGAPKTDMSPCPRAALTT